MLGFYFVLSALLFILADIDICIPCIFKTFLGVSCPGCGLTTAFISLIELNFTKAYESNWLIFIILPFAIFYSIKDFFVFWKNFNLQTPKS
jgi:hypothetical protein